MIVKKTSDSEETISFGKRVGELLEKGDFLALTGELGSGKTCFVQGVAAGLDVEVVSYVRSPSYTLINEYQGRIPVYHFDLFRLESREEIEALGYEEYFYDCGVTIVEWAEKIKTLLPMEHLWIEFEHVAETMRRISVVPHGEKMIHLAKQLT